MRFELKLNNKNISDTEIIEDLKSVAKNLHKTTMSSSDYETHGTYHIKTVSNRFNSWSNALSLAGLNSAIQMNIEKSDLLSNIQEVWSKLGRQPTRREMKKPLSKYSTYPYIRVFKSWNNALIEFVDWIHTEYNNEESIISNPNEVKSDNGIIHKTNRNISDRLRFRILMRDGFTCKSCGRSPIKDMHVELHVDHIKPWSKGGETESDNLITKCKKCNLGKGNAFDC